MSSSWFDWSLVENNADDPSLCQPAVRAAATAQLEHERDRVSLSTMLRDAKKAWHGIKLDQPDWGDDSYSVALGGELRSEGLHFHLILNAYWEPLEFELPSRQCGTPWRRWIDTSLDSPHDIVPWESAPTISENPYRVEPRSVVMLFMSRQANAVAQPGDKVVSSTADVCPVE